jgi:hypothetical protein
MKQRKSLVFRTIEMPLQLSNPRSIQSYGPSYSSAYKNTRWTELKPQVRVVNIDSDGLVTVSISDVQQRTRSAAITTLKSSILRLEELQKLLHRELAESSIHIALNTPQFKFAPSWFNELDETIEDQVLYEPDEGFPAANSSAMREAANIVRTLYGLVGDSTPEPYFDVALDSGVDIYFDFGKNELQVHSPPPGSINYYCFIRLNGERSVVRQPSYKMLANILKQVVAANGVLAE